MLDGRAQHGERPGCGGGGGGGGGGVERAEDRQVGRLGPAGGEDDLAGMAPQVRRHLVPRLLEQTPGPLRRAMAPRRVPERLGPGFLHGACHFGSQRRGGRVVEIRRGARTHVIQTVLALVNSFSPSSESSRPKPERLIPPNGSSGVEATMALTNTAPASISSMQRRCSSSSFVHTLEPSPNEVE